MFGLKINLNLICFLVQILILVTSFCYDHLSSSVKGETEISFQGEAVTAQSASELLPPAGYEQVLIIGSSKGAKGWDFDTFWYIWMIYDPSSIPKSFILFTLMIINVTRIVVLCIFLWFFLSCCCNFWSVCVFYLQLTTSWLLADCWLLENKSKFRSITGLIWFISSALSFFFFTLKCSIVLCIHASSHLKCLELILFN